MTDARLLARVREDAPHIQIEALRIDAETGPYLRSGEADLALGLIPELESGFYQQTLFAQDWMCLANPEHPRIRETLSLSDYANEAHIGIVSGTGHRLLEHAVDQARIERRIVLELPRFLGLAAILLTTDLIATLPRQTGETLAAASGLKTLSCPVPVPSFTVKQHWHTRFHNDGGNIWLRGLYARLFQQPEGNESA